MYLGCMLGCICHMQAVIGRLCESVQVISLSKVDICCYVLDYMVTDVCLFVCIMF